ncbi:MAG TPA: hypothetical protein DIT48_11145 [Actinobacteria bacterium]|jgi:hypothetical protein|nr:hypothetical protein [Actinomycetota bacterium]
MIRGLLILASPLYMYLLLGASRMGFEVGLRHHDTVVAELPQTASFAADPSIPALRRLDSAELLADAARDASPRTTPSSAPTSASAQPAPAANTSPANPAATAPATKSGGGSGPAGGAKPTPTPHGRSGR